MGRLDLAVLDDEGVPLPAHATEDGMCVEPEVEGLGEFARGVPEEPNLRRPCERDVPKAMGSVSKVVIKLGR